jgi:5-amino-6-(5-phosphoribosylamino)uracil reductase
MFFDAGAVDELRLAVAPFFVNDPAAPRFTGMGQMKLNSVEQLGQMTVMHLITPDEHYLRAAIAESRKCMPSSTAYSVGAVIVTAAGDEFTGYTGETGPHDHAEEAAISKALAAGADLTGATMYSSMEPCSVRKSKPESCSALIIRHRFARAIFAYYEPLNFVDGQGAEVLRKAGIDIKAMNELAHEVIEINKHNI